MTDHPLTAAGTWPPRSLTAWLRHRQQQISERVHAAGDADAISRDWAVTVTTGRLGMGGRTYRDPRFDSRAAGRSLQACGSPEPVRLGDAIEEWAQRHPARLVGRVSGPGAHRTGPEAGA